MLLRTASHKEIVNKEAFEQLAAEAGLADEPSHLSEQAVRTPTTTELETEEIYQRARPLPMVRHWLTRCVVVAVASLATPFVADLLHPAGESPPAEATDRHAEGTSHERSRAVDMQWSLLLLLVLIGLALVLERLREVLEESLAKHAAVVERIWSELAVLGSLSLTSHVLVQGGVLGRVSVLAYGDETHEAYLLRRFEAVHRSLLCGLASFLVCALLLLRAAVVAERQWGSYEAFIACYTLGGTAAAAPRDHRHDYGARLCREELLQAQRMLAASRRSPCRLDCCCDSRDGWELHIARQRDIFQRLRQRFILMPTDQGQPPLAQDFELTDYLLECTKLQLRAALRLGSRAWLCVGLALLLVCELTLALGPGVGQALLVLAGWLAYAQACLVEQHYVWLVEQLIPLDEVASARVELASLRTPSLLARPAYLWLHEWGKPEHQRGGIMTRVRCACAAASDSYREEQSLRSLASQGFCALGEAAAGAASELGHCSSGARGGGGGGSSAGIGGGGGGGGTGGVAGGRAADNEAGEKVNQGTSSELASLASAPSEGGAGRAAAAAAAVCVAAAGGVSLSALRSAEGAAAEEEARRAELVQLQKQMPHHGESTHVSPPLPGERRHLDPLLARPSQQEGTADPAAMKRMAERPAQRWLQCMLLFGAVHATLSVVSCTPRGAWDLAIAVGVLPVLIALVFKVPSVLQPMVLSLSLEALVDRRAVQQVCQQAQLRKLLQSVQAQARLHDAKRAAGLDGL